MVPHIKIEFRQEELKEYQRIFVRVYASTQASYRIRPILSKGYQYYDKIEEGVSEDLELSS